jgi:hypothetical protein
VFSQGELSTYLDQHRVEFLERATQHTREFLKATGQWKNDMVHEKMATRWAYETLERFLTSNRAEAPTRPLPLFDSFVARYYSQIDGHPFSNNSPSPLSSFLHCLFTRAVCSRDALVAVFYHLYGLGQQPVARILGFGPVQLDRVYKNYKRWREVGWPLMLQEAKLRESVLARLTNVAPAQLHREATRIIPDLQSHYRKSEPLYYPCVTESEWRCIYDDDRAHDYRSWHLAFCFSCLKNVCRAGILSGMGLETVTIDIRVQPAARIEDWGTGHTKRLFLK